MRFVVAIRFQGKAKRVFDIRRSENGGFYANLLHASPPPGLPPLDRHMSYHSSGERHLRVKGKGVVPIKVVPLQLPRPPLIRGVQQLLKTGLFLGQFANLKPLRQRHDRVIVLDADDAGFREGAIFLNVFLVEPWQEDQIPMPVNAGPRIVHIDKRTTPWFAIEVFQQELAEPACRAQPPSQGAPRPPG